MLLTLGTRLLNYSNGTFSVLSKQYHIDPTCVSIPTGKADLQRSALMSIAKSLLNTPYLWGGKSAMGLDCSGFTQVVYAAVGINILRNAREQITQGKEVASLADALPGDLAFFDHSDRDPKATNISHVGMLISPTQIIHCAGGCVHIDRIDANGIHLSDGTMTHHLVKIKRYL
jgi:cell wall-associated NlpC family hydrolase